MAFKPKGKAGLKKKDDKGRNNLFKRRKFCRFTAEKIEHVDYKDVEILKDFITENAKIMPARITGTRTVKVKDGYARNFLIPQGKAKRATESNRKLFEEKRAELEKAAAEKLAESQAQAAKMDGLMVQITRKAGVDGRLFGSVSNFDIADALKALGHDVERAMIRMPEGPIKIVGDNHMEVALHTEVVAKITVSVLGEH